MARWLDGSMARWLDGSMARWLDGSMARWLDGSMARCFREKKSKKPKILHFIDNDKKKTAPGTLTNNRLELVINYRTR